MIAEPFALAVVAPTETAMQHAMVAAIMAASLIASEADQPTAASLLRQIATCVARGGTGSVDLTALTAAELNAATAVLSPPGPKLSWAIDEFSGEYGVPPVAVRVNLQGLVGALHGAVATLAGSESGTVRGGG